MVSDLPADAAVRRIAMPKDSCQAGRRCDKKRGTRKQITAREHGSPRGASSSRDNVARHEATREQAAKMEATIFFIKGVFVGFVIAAPVGPVGIMCIHRTIAQGKIAGYVSGLGAALADTFFGAIAAFGFGFIAGPLIEHNNWLRFVGGSVLCLIGLRSLLTRKLPPPATRDRKGLIGDFVSAFLVTLTNPITVISFAAIYAALNIPHLADNLRWGFALTLGVFVGAAVWWLLLTIVAGAFHGRVAERGVLWINRISGAVILIFGVLLLISLVSMDNDQLERRLTPNERGMAPVTVPFAT